VSAVLIAVIDGDTILVDVDGSEETVGLLGIDTPEKVGGPRPGECFGAEATAFATRLLPAGTYLVLTRDHETRDQYGRLLAYVHRRDGLFVNLAMLEYGYATPLFFTPNTSMSHVFEQAANFARRQWLGFWPACGAADVVLPPEP
jgi:micrococcal nuclease